MQIETRPAHTQADFLFDWKLDVERLEREAERAAAVGRPDPWTLVEAECSLDLIDAELLATRSKSAASVKRERTVQALQGWRARVQRVIRALKSLGGSDAGSGTVRHSA